MKLHNQLNKSSLFIYQGGFTLIELIIVIIILGILSATVTPKFFTSKGFSEHAYRSDVIAKLRLIQIKAMQQTGDNALDCHQVLITSTKIGAPDDCDDTPSFTSDWDASKQATGIEINSSDNVSFSSNVAGNSFSFNSLGRPSPCAPCEISIIGEQTLKIKIEAEGYIHAL